MDVSASYSYARAEDAELNEPVFGIAPFEQRYAVQLHTEDHGRWVELDVTVAADQDRVATSRLEQATDGWMVVDIRAGAALGRGVSLRAGLDNLTDKTYATHLNALNPFTRQCINEIGRSFYLGLEAGF